MTTERAQWNIGDVVRLKSGGPAMVVASRRNATSSERAAECQWFTRDGILQTEELASELLVPGDPDNWVCYPG